MGMGRHLNEETELPDTFGLQEYFITDVVTEIDGPNVRVVWGVRRGGSIHWLCSSVLRADRLIAISKECGNAAEEAFSLNELLHGKGH